MTNKLLRWHYLFFIVSACAIVYVVWYVAFWLSDHAKIVQETPYSFLMGSPWPFDYLGHFIDTFMDKVMTFIRTYVGSGNPTAAFKHGCFLAIFGTAIIAVALVINIAAPKKWSTNLFLFMIVSLLYATIFSFPNIRIKEDLLDSAVEAVRACRQLKTNANPETNAGTKVESRVVADTKNQDHPINLDEKSRKTMTMELIKAEHTKAIEEIKLRTNIDDQWYNSKFILVGGLFAAFFAYFSNFLSKSGKELASKDIVDGRIYNRWTFLITDAGNMFKTILPSSILGMACTVSLAIDLHIRSNGMVTRQLGLWIYNYVECMIVDTSISGGYLGWEMFLRINDDNIQGMHMDYLISMLDAVHFYFTSIYLYFIYFGCLIFYFSQNKCESGEFKVFLFVFFLVHVTLGIFSFGGNSFPSTLEVQLTIWPKVWLSGDKGGWTPLVICMMVTGLAFMRLYTLYRTCSQDSDHNAGATNASAHPSVQPLEAKHERYSPYL